jgi:hypothetical protein
VTAGYVVSGALLYADFCTGTLWSVPVEGGTPVVIVETGLRIASFAHDAAGELYVLAHGGAIHRLVRVR